MTSSTPTYTLFLRARGPIDDTKIAAAAKDLASAMIATGDANERFDGPEQIAHALADVTPFDTLTEPADVYACPRSDDDAREIKLLWTACVMHLLSSGALDAAVRHAVETATQEIGERRDEHLTSEELASVYACSELPARDRRRHLPHDVMTDLRHHALLCQQCCTALEAIYLADQILHDETSKGGAS